MTKEIPLINTNLVTLVDDEDYEWLSSFRWYVGKGRHGAIYAERCLQFKKDGKWQTQARQMQRDILDPEMKLPSRAKISDHRNHDTLDNQKENLRLVTNSQSNINRRYSEAQGKRGVRFEPSEGTYRAAIKVGGKKYSSRHFLSIEEAARAYNWLALKYHGEFARLNIGADGQPLEPIPPNPRKTKPKTGSSLMQNDATHDLAVDIKRLVRGLDIMLNKQEQQTALLLAILEAVSVGDKESSPLVDALKELTVTVNGMPKHLHRPLRQIIREELDRVV